MSKTVASVFRTRSAKRKFDESHSSSTEELTTSTIPDPLQSAKAAEERRIARNQIVPWLVPKKPTRKNIKDSTAISSFSQSVAKENTSSRPPLTSIENRNKRNGNLDLEEESFFGKTDWQRSDFIFRKRIGTGGFSTVYEATCLQFGSRRVALKQVNYESLRRLSRNNRHCAFLQEFQLQRSLQHENIVQAFGFFRGLIIRNAVMILEYCNKGDLQDYLSDNSFPVTEERSHRYSKQIANAIVYLHTTAKILHMDMKLENVLISEADVAKLTDFGFSIKMHSMRKVHFKSRGGTRWYKPPEQLRGGYFDSTADIWAFGCIAFEMILGYHPFFSTENSNEDVNSELEEPNAVQRMIAAQQGNFRRPERFERACAPFKTFISEVLAYSRIRRPTANKLCSLEWLSS